jgi:predicted metal-dependent hydrolase
MKTQIITIDGAGEVAFRRNPRARRVAIRVKPFDGVTVSYPRFVSLAIAKRLVQSKADWILKRLGEVRRHEETAILPATPGGNVTRTHRLEMIPLPDGPVSVRVQGGVIRVRHPASVDAGDPAVRRAIRKGVISACRREALAYFPPRVEELARLHGFTIERVAVKNLRSRWGSCSLRGIVNLNLQLMRLPDHLVDYVILHELVHTRIRNHSREFWDLLTSVVGNARQLDRELTRDGQIL